MGSDLGNKKIMARNIKRYLDITGTTRKELADAISAPYTTVCGWMSAKAYPRIDKIELMAKFFHIQKKDLVEDEFSFDMQNTGEDHVYHKVYKYTGSFGHDMLFKSADGATEDELIQTANYLNFLKSKRKD